MNPTRRSPRTLVPAALLALLAAGPLHAQAPSNFYLEGFAGGRAPWEALAKVVVDSAGNGSYYVMSASDRATGTFVLVQTFTLSGAQLNTLWSSVTANSYFSLSPLYETVQFDGSFCNLLIRGGASQLRVITINTIVPAFDNVVRDLNALTPGALDLEYNAIASPAPQPGPARAVGPRLLAGQGTTVTRDGCTITVTMNIDITGAKADAATAAAFKADIEGKWNGPSFLFSWCPVKFVANVNVGATKGAHHQIAIAQADFRSVVDSLRPNNGPGTTGTWKNTAGADNTAAHEAGHLMGLDDKYNDDPTTGVSVPKAGHENDCMASLHKGATPAVPRQDAIDQIINAAGITCPAICCIWDPIPIPPYLCSLGTTCDATLTGHNRENFEPLRILNAFTTNPAFQVFPPNAFIPPGGQQPFNVSFTPADCVPQEGYVIMIRDTPGGPVQDSIPVSGQGVGASVPAIPAGGLVALGVGLMAAGWFATRRRRETTIQA